jgi:hypothetical protein
MREGEDGGVGGDGKKWLVLLRRQRVRFEWQAVLQHKDLSFLVEGPVVQALALVQAPEVDPSHGLY